MITLEVPAANGNGAAQTFRGGWATIYMTGDFDDGTGTLKFSDDGTTYGNVLDEFGNVIALTGSGTVVVYANFHLAGPVLLRVTVSGSSSSTAIVCHVRMGRAAVKQGEAP